MRKRKFDNGDAVIVNHRSKHYKGLRGKVMKSTRADNGKILYELVNRPCLDSFYANELDHA